MGRCFAGSGEITDITLMPVKLGFNTGSETMEGLPYFAEGAEGEKIFERYKTLSEKFGTELIYENGFIKIKE